MGSEWALEPQPQLAWVLQPELVVGWLVAGRVVAAGLDTAGTGTVAVAVPPLAVQARPQFGARQVRSSRSPGILTHLAVYLSSNTCIADRLALAPVPQRRRMDTPAHRP